MNNNEWKLPLNLAIGFHVLLVLAVIYMPGLFHSKPLYPDVYTVNLVNMAEPTPKTGTPTPKREPIHRKSDTTKPVVKPKPVVKQEHIQTAPVEKAISLKPLKRKIEKDSAYDKLIAERLRQLKIRQRRERELERKQRLEKIHRQRLAESIKAEQQAEQEARQAAEELKQLLRSSSTVAKNENTGSQNNGSQGTSNNFSAIENQYFASISNRIQQFWALPELKNWDPSLSAVVWITINKDGIIINQHFENSSGDKFFDQYVEKALRDSVPLPRIPAALNKSQIEVGLRFKPNGIQ